MNEIEENRLFESRATLYVALMQFCKEASDHDPCLNYRNCDECSVRKRTDELRDQVIFNV